MSDADFWQWVTLALIVVWLGVRAGLNDHRERETRRKLDIAGRGYIAHNKRGEYKER